jgi:hypothetical protein
VQQYLLTNLTVGQTTLAETQAFMREQIHGGIQCNAPDTNATQLDCQVDGLFLGCDKWTYNVHYAFSEGFLANVTVKGIAGICL